MTEENDDGLVGRIRDHRAAWERFLKAPFMSRRETQAENEAKQALAMLLQTSASDIGEVIELCDHLDWYARESQAIGDKAALALLANLTIALQGLQGADETWIDF